jgi:type II secretion system protein D
LNTRVKVVADYRTNSLIVQASPRDIAEVARLILEIDVESTPAENEIRVFPIKNAVAADLQPILQSAINGTSTGSTNTQQGGFQQQQQQSSGSGRSTPPSSRLSIVAREGAEVNSGILAGVVITSNPSINTLIVRAPSKSMPLIAALIDQLDQLPSAEARMKVYPVVNGDATSLVTIIQQAFGLPATGTNTNQQQGAGLFGLQNLAALVGGGESSLVPLRISADTRTNTIIASGGASDLDVIEALLYRLDEAGGNQRTTEVIWLRNANAADVNVALTNLFQGQRTLAQTLTTQGFNQQNQQVSLFERADREVLTIFVSPESSTNSIIVSATPRYMKQIREVIERLDRQQPMIFVEMLIAEVALTDQFEMGTELGLQDSLLFDRNSATGGTLGSPVFNILTPLTTAAPQRRVANVAGQGSSGFSLGRTSGDLGYGGLVLAASSESVGLLFRMLQDANRAQVLARPTLTTIDNNISVVNVGKSVPILGNSTNTVSGVTQSVQYINTGLTMQIQPRTNQDGLINMIVAISRSSVSDADSLTIANGDQTSTTPAFNQTLAQTRVTAYDGQTVVLGGLITKERVSQSRRIPWLADIPIAGALFRFDKETEARTELLVVMTPRVINFNDPNKLDMIKQVESSRMSWCLADVLNVYSDQGLSAGNGLWGPATSPVIYPDVTPTVDRENDPNCQPGAPNYIQPSDSYIQPSDSYIQPMEGQMLLEDPSQSNPPMLIEPNGFNSSRSQPRSILQLESSEGSGVVNPARPMQNSSYIPVVPNGNGQVVQTNYVPVSPMLPPAPNAVNPAAGSRK